VQAEGEIEPREASDSESRDRVRFSHPDRSAGEHWTREFDAEPDGVDGRVTLRHDTTIFDARTSTVDRNG